MKAVHGIKAKIYAGDGGDALLEMSRSALFDRRGGSPVWSISEGKADIGQTSPKRREGPEAVIDLR
jgi:hypothetical protein